MSTETVEWIVKCTDLAERNQDYTGTFACTNGETGAQVVVSITQEKGLPATDLVAALRVVAERLRRVDADEESGFANLN